MSGPTTPTTPTTPTAKSKQVDNERQNLTPKEKKEFLMREFRPPSEVKDQKRRLILDEEQFEAAFLKCMVCQEVYDRVTHVPKVLPCQHNLCLSCLLEMFRVESEYRVQMTTAFGNRGPTAVKITCPACRVSVVKSEGEIRALPNDVTLLELGEFVRGSERCVVSFCHKHPTVPMNFFCDTCQVQICCECTSRDHGTGHDVVGVDTAARETDSDVTATLELAVTECKDIAGIRKTVEGVIHQLDATSEDIAHDIAHSFTDKFTDTSRMRIDELISISREEIGRKREYLVEQLQSLCKREAELNASSSLLQEARASADFQQISIHHEIIKQTLSDRPVLPLCSVEDVRAMISGVGDEVVSAVEVRDVRGNRMT